MILTRSLDELMQTTSEYLRSETPYTNLSSGSVLKALATSINSNIATLHSMIDSAFLQSSVATASGVYLDAIGRLVGVERGTTKRATTRKYPNSFKFKIPYNQTALQFAGGAFTVPAGTLIGARTATYDDDFLFVTAEDATFLASSKEVFVNVEALDTGSRYNVSEGTLVSHSYKTHPELECVNEWAIVGGIDSMTDEEMRFSILNASLTNARANKAALMLALLKIPGVAEVNFQEWARGGGSFDVYIVSTSGNVTQSLVDEAQQTVDEFEAFGIRGTVVAPEELNVTLEMRVSFTDKASDADKTTIRDSITTEIKSYIDNIPMGGEIILNEIVQRSMGVSELIYDIKILLMTIDGSPALLSNYTAERYQKFLASTSVSTPIEVI